MVRMMMMRGEVEFFCIASMKVRMMTTMMLIMATWMLMIKTNMQIMMIINS